MLRTNLFNSFQIRGLRCKFSSSSQICSFPSLTQDHVLDKSKHKEDGLDIQTKAVDQAREEKSSKNRNYKEEKKREAKNKSPSAGIGFQVPSFQSDLSHSRTKGDQRIILHDSIIESTRVLVID